MKWLQIWWKLWLIGFKDEGVLGSGGNFEVGSADLKPLISLLLQRKRELSNLLLAQAAERLGASSRNAYTRYEQGRSVPTVGKLKSGGRSLVYKFLFFRQDEPSRRAISKATFVPNFFPCRQILLLVAG